MLLRDCSVKQCSWQLEHENLAALRRKVFIEEQEVPEHLEWDGQDIKAKHFLLYHPSGQVIGCARLLDDGKIGRMAVLQAFRSKGLGTKLLNYVISWAQENGFHSLMLDAQTHATSFYQQFGFKLEGEVFDDAGIDHIKMKLEPVPQILCLGLSKDRLALQKNKDYPALLTQMALQAKYNVSIFSYQLNPELFANEDFVNALSELARSHPRSRVNILIRESRDLAKTHHPLVELMRQIPDKVQIRLLTRRPEAHTEEYFVADSIGLMLRKNYKDDYGYICFNQPAKCEELTEQFESMWQRSYQDKRLRQL